MFEMLGSGVPAVLTLLISVVYFFSSPATESTGKSLAVSAHGVLIAALYFAVIVLSAHPAEAYAIPFMVLCVGGLLLVFFTIWQFKGRRVFHFLQIVNILVLSLVFVFGLGSITGDD